MKRVGFDEWVAHLRGTLAALPDRRQGKNLSDAMEDFGLSAFSVFFTQSPSFLAHQRTMQQARGSPQRPEFLPRPADPLRQLDPPDARPDPARDALSGV